MASLYPDMGKKLVVIGDTAVGKTHLCLSLMDSTLWQFDDDYPFDDFMIHKGIYKSPSVGIINFPYDDFKDAGKRFRFQIFDRAGEYKVCPLEPNDYFYDNISGALLVYDMTNSKSFDHLGSWLEVLKKETPGSTLAITIVGNKLDLANSGSVSTTNGQSFANEHGCLFFETSALENKNIKKAFESVFKKIISIRSDQAIAHNPHAIRAAQNTYVGDSSKKEEQEFNPHKMRGGQNIDDGIIWLQNKPQDKKKPCCKPCCCGT